MGKYREPRVYLDGGKPYGTLYADGWGEKPQVLEDKPLTLKIGGPLRQQVTAERYGNTLQLQQVLVGMGGEQYVRVKREHQPTVAVCRGDSKVASGAFRYG